MGVMACIEFGFREDNYIKILRVVTLALNTPTGPPLNSYQILSKYVKRFQSYGVHKDVSTEGWIDGWTDAMLIAIFPEPVGREN